MRIVPIISILFAIALAGQSARAEAVEFGPRVGARIPTPVTLTDTKGEVVDFKDIAGQKGLVMAFVRSAAWCPYCQLQLKDLQNIAGDLAQLGYPLVAVSYDSPEVLSRFARQHGLTYPLLSDQESRMIDAFDIRDPQYKPNSFAYGVPRPVIFVIDADGVVRAKLAEEGYKTRPALAAIMAAVAQVSGAN